MDEVATSSTTSTFAEGAGIPVVLRKRTHRRANHGQAALLTSLTGQWQLQQQPQNKHAISLSSHTANGWSIQQTGFYSKSSTCQFSHGQTAPFAALSLSWLPMLHREHGLQSAISKGFEQIDLDQSGSLSLQDLTEYAKSHGLPLSYVKDFMKAVLNNHEDSKPATQQESKPQQAITPQLEGVPMACVTAAALQTTIPAIANVNSNPWDMFVQFLVGNQQGHYGKEQQPRELTYQMFDKFVRSRETALRRAFDMFDRDGDGVISASDLEASLAHIAICCPRTRCIYRCPRMLARAMLEKTRAAGQTDGSSVDFTSFRRFFMLLPQTDMAVEYWLRAGTQPLYTDKLPAVHDGEEPSGPRIVAWGHLLAGAVAGAASRTATAPLETLRLAVMTGSMQSSDLVAAANSIVQEQGWRGLFRGNGVNVLRSAPQKALDFFAFDMFKRLLASWDNKDSDGSAGSPAPSAMKTFAAAGLAGATSWAMLYPLETVRSRITAGLTAPGAGLLSVAQGIITKEGVPALYRGLGWSLAGIFPEAALCYGLHDLLKHLYRQSHHDQEPGVLPSLSFGVISAFSGQLVAFPLETIARRLQVYQGPGGLPQMLQAMLKEGGVGVLYRGVGAATLRLIPMAVVSFGTYELVRSALVALEARADAAAARAEYTQLHTCCDTSASTTTSITKTCPTVAEVCSSSILVQPLATATAAALPTDIAACVVKQPCSTVGVAAKTSTCPTSACGTVLLINANNPGVGPCSITPCTPGSNSGATETVIALDTNATLPCIPLASTLTTVTSITQQ